jgi:PKD repeat protein
MFRKLMPIFVLLFLINCGGGGGGGDDPGPGPSNDPPVANFSATPLSGSTP